MTDLSAASTGSAGSATPSGADPVQADDAGADGAGDDAGLPVDSTADRGSVDATADEAGSVAAEGKQPTSPDDTAVAEGSTDDATGSRWYETDSASDEPGDRSTATDGERSDDPDTGADGSDPLAYKGTSSAGESTERGAETEEARPEGVEPTVVGAEAGAGVADGSAIDGGAADPAAPHGDGSGSAATDRDNGSSDGAGVDSPSDGAGVDGVPGDLSAGTGSGAASDDAAGEVPGSADGDADTTDERRIVATTGKAASGYDDSATAGPASADENTGAAGGSPAQYPGGGPDIGATQAIPVVRGGEAGARSTARDDAGAGTDPDRYEGSGAAARNGDAAARSERPAWPVDPDATQVIRLPRDEPATAQADQPTAPTDLDSTQIIRLPRESDGDRPPADPDATQSMQLPEDEPADLDSTQVIRLPDDDAGAPQTDEPAPADLDSTQVIRQPDDEPDSARPDLDSTQVIRLEEDTPAKPDGPTNLDSPQAIRRDDDAAAPADPDSTQIVRLPDDVEAPQADEPTRADLDSTQVIRLDEDAAAKPDGPADLDSTQVIRLPKDGPGTEPNDKPADPDSTQVIRLDEGTPGDGKPAEEPTQHLAPPPDKDTDATQAIERPAGEPRTPVDPDATTVIRFPDRAAKAPDTEREDGDEPAGTRPDDPDATQVIRLPRNDDGSTRWPDWPVAKPSGPSTAPEAPTSGPSTPSGPSASPSTPPGTPASGPSTPSGPTAPPSGPRVPGNDETQRIPRQTAPGQRSTPTPPGTPPARPAARPAAAPGVPGVRPESRAAQGNASPPEPPTVRLSHAPVLPPAPPREPAPAIPAPAHGRSRGLLIGVLAALGVLVLLAGALAVFRPGPVERLFADGTSPSPSPSTAGPSPVLQPAVGAAAPTPEGVARELAPLLKDYRLGDRVAVSVVDVATHSSLYGATPNAPELPASVTKLVTASAALHVRGPDYRLTTRVVAGSKPGEVILVGGGDPTLATNDHSIYPQAARLDKLADQVKKALGGVRPTRVLVDSSLYSGGRLGPGWDSDIVSGGDAAPIAPVMLNSGRIDPDGATSARSTEPDLDAGRKLAELIGAPQHTVTHTTAATGAKQLGAVQSPPLLHLVEMMLQRSDNVIAEALARQVALARNQPATFAGGAAATIAVMHDLGLPVNEIRLSDGSGLSRRNRISPEFLTDLLATVTDGKHPRLWPVYTGMPVAGYTGTLSDRYVEGSDRSAAGLVRAKTGSLNGTSTLAGLVMDADGRLLAFAMMAEGTGDNISAEAALDDAATALAGCGCR
ncbi:D-alanyl-D-alanine carboxypeptidase/D-alanyl-D-alanine endopeptidase [Actinocatenispora rupis]|uniref:D-alanyl-D-alanine carboxypeptidase/D-alanyl-D-alanine endopeptidase n=1 Tax=Actinocatenispora rupis TaxID=519421 RepID=UPI001EF3A3CA|nr:D-alanyl-D-alanine carboxypeptidase/D-alanyl-D-alanine-endopeptidase [Actinocatenispora rupis]